MKTLNKIETYGSFGEILAAVAKIYGSRIFLVEGDREHSFEAFNRLVNRGCRYLEAEGVKPGAIVSVILKNSLDYLVIYFATLKLGGVINPFPFHLGAEEVREKLLFVKPAVIITHGSHWEKLKESGLNVKLFQLDRMKQFSDAEYQTTGIDPDATAFMYYSSGTTGSPKIIEYSSRSEIMTMASVLRSGFIEPGACHLCFLPLGHTAAIRYTILPCLLTGSKIILAESYWKIRAQLWRLVEKHRVTFFELVPSILIAILNTPGENIGRIDISSLKFIGCGSAFLARDLQDKFEQKFKVPVANMYGLSETGPTHFDNPFEAGRRTGTVGRPFDIIDAKVFDENGNEVKAGELGEFGVRGPSLLKGYYKDREQFEACFKNGYFMTGDLGYVDERGIFYYVDRKKDLIIKGGVNIVPSQIDEVLLAHPSVQEAATIGVPDMLLGENIKSYVVLKGKPALMANELRLFCRERLGDFKCPASFEFISELPKGPSGKILKRMLREDMYIK